MRITSRLGRLLLLAALAIIAQACNQTPAPASQTLAVTDASLPALSTPEQADAYQLPTLSEGQINIREVNGFSDEYNTWYIYGLISNDTSRTVNDIMIEIQLLDAGGGVLYTDTTNPAIRTLTPGEDAPFILYTYEALTGVHTIAAFIVGNGSSEVARANLDFSGTTVWYDSTFNDVYLSGNVTNNTADPVLISGLAAALLHEDGRLASANAAFPFLNYLAPGISAPFRVIFDVPADEAATWTNYNLYLDAKFTTQAGLLNLVTSQEHTGYLDAYEKFHLVGTISNNTEAYQNVRLVAGIFNDAGDCIDAASLYLPVAVSPGESLPYDFDLWGALDSTREAYRSATQYEIYIDWYATSEAYIIPVKITTSGDSNSYDGYSATFSGNVVNNAGRALDSATVIVALFDRTTGEMIVTDYTHVSGPIEDGGTVPYAVNLYPQADFDPTLIEFTIMAFGQ
jgi:hypothetical protein